VKKLISIGVALALLSMAVVPVAVAAQDGGAGNYTPPQTYAKVPFAIIASGIDMVGQLVDAIPMIADALPAGLDITAITNTVAPWTYGPLSWTVDMLGWGLALGADIWTPVDDALGIGFPWLSDVLDTVACGLRTAFDASPAGNWTCPE